MRFVALALLLAGCATPAPQFLGAEGRTVHAAGRDFTLFRKGNEVQIIRHGMASPAERARLLGVMPAVIEADTGCKVLPKSLNGDAGVIRARIRC